MKKVRELLIIAFSVKSYTHVYRGFESLSLLFCLLNRFVSLLDWF
ncbi:hypothetical protein HanRHA438_Chr13g0612181 [Helianthus annuus]|nr:hypothetical protein HanRHA438_Chr13g0612181 [Helianthus annuus]